MKRYIKSNTTENEIVIYLFYIYADNTELSIAANKWVEQRNIKQKFTEQELSDYDDIIQSFISTMRINGLDVKQFKQVSNSYSGYITGIPKDEKIRDKIKYIIPLLRLSNHYPNNDNFETDTVIQSMINIIQNENSDIKITVRRSYIIDLNNIKSNIMQLNNMVDDIREILNI